MTSVLLGLGSNIDRESHLCTGLDRLSADFGLRRISSAWESEAMGFDGPAFINLAAEIDTDVSLAELARYIRQLEYRMGRPRNATRFSSRTLDVDILCYGDLVGEYAGVELPRPEITENAYVLAPLAELVPERRLPGTGKRFAELWQQLAEGMQPVTRVPFDCGGWRLPAEPGS